MSEAAASRLDPLKWGIVTVLVVAGVVGNSYFSDQSLLYRVLALLAAAAVAGWVASTTERGGAFWQLIKGSRTEIRKVVWPTRNQLTTYTAVVLVFVSFIIAVVSLIDLVLGRLVFWVFG